MLNDTSDPIAHLRSAATSLTFALRDLETMLPELASASLLQDAEEWASEISLLSDLILKALTRASAT